MDVSIIIPKKLVEEIARRGLDLEEIVLNSLIEKLRLDPATSTEVRLELARRYFREGAELVDKDPVQASEKLYKATEKCVKALAIYFNLDNVLREVEKKGRWTVTELEKAVEAISDKIDKWFTASWDSAWALHVWGFHEAKLDGEAVKRRLPYIEKMLEEAEKIVSQTK
ncbi:MAG: PaREP1 family protein [Desulfurococcales archaeon]|nr:PaREP1 family protein [Desulfurococcales archaeon]